MKFIKMFAIFLFPAVLFSDVLVLPTLDTSIVKKGDVNKLFKGMYGTIVPRTSNGVPTHLSATLGTPSLPWNELFVLDSFNGRYQFGPILNSNSKKLARAGNATGTYATQLESSGGVSLTTTGRPVFMYVANQSGSGSIASYLEWDSVSFQECDLNFRFTIDGSVVVTEQSFGNSDDTTLPSNPLGSFLPLTMFSAIYNGVLSEDVHTFDFEMRTIESDTGTCPYEIINGEFYVLEM